MSIPNTTEMMNDFTSMEPRDNFGHLPNDVGLLVKFYKKATYSKLASEAEGRPIYHELNHVLILVPGDNLTRIDTLVTEEHIKRFPHEYDAFMKNERVTENGTPLEECPFLTTSQVQEFKHFNIRTVEALAELSDSSAQKFMGINALRAKAKNWLKTSADSAIVEKQDKELAKRDAEIADLRKMIEDIAKSNKKETAK